MKHLTSLLMTLAMALVTSLATAQAPQGFSFQAIVRDNLGDPLMNTAVGMRLSVLQGSASGTAVYVETHAPTTNANGLASVQVGGGTPVTGTFAGINWGAGPYFLKSETDPNGGTSYTISGTQQLMSVPYALYAANAGSGSSSWTVTGNDQASAVSGNVGIGTTAAPATKLEVNGSISIDGNAPLELGRGVADKETNAGKIGYQTFSSALDIVGAGSTGSNRKIKFYNEGGANFTGGVAVGSGSTPPANGLVVGGNTGLGTATPTAKLQVMGSGQELLRVGVLGAQTIDQTFYNGSSPGVNATGHWQSFLVTITGQLIYRPAIAGGSGTLTASLYAGTGTGGTLLETQTGLYMQNPATVGFSSLVTAGQTYTIAFSDGVAGDVNQWRASSGYPNGTNDLGGDFFIETQIVSVPQSVVVDALGHVGVGTTTPAASLDVAGTFRMANGTQGTGKVLTSDANGVATWQNAASGADNMGNHIATTTLQLNNNWLSNDGGAEGIRVDNNGNVGIGVAPLLAESKLVIGAQDAVDEGGEIQLNAGGSWGTKAYFMDVYQNGLRIMDGTTAGSSNVRMQISNAGVVSVNNGLQVGAAGTTFAKMQGGTATLGAGAAGVNSFTITFPTAFASVPKVTCTVRNGSGAGATEMFAVTTKQISATQFSVNVVRLDVASAGWGQALQLDWMAFE